MQRIIYYYQTFNGLEKIIANPYCTHIHISSIHFGTDHNNVPYIHLNDLHPNNSTFDKMWNDAKILSNMGVKIVLMIGGAGGAFVKLFENFDAYYALLKQTLSHYPFITGIDLNIEESVGLNPVINLITQLKHDFPKYSLSMAPVQYALMTNNKGLGGFVYKELLKTPQGKLIDYFNGQFYINYSFEAFELCIKNGFKPNKIVMGMISSQYTHNSTNEIKLTLQKIYQKYPQFGGVFIWEQFDSYSVNSTWDNDMKNILN